MERVAVVDAAGLMVGFGEGGIARPDVPKTMPQVTSDRSGWWALSPEGAQSYEVFGIDLDARSACPIGRIRLTP